MSRTLWFLFAAFIVYGTTIPFRFTTDREAVGRNLHSLTLNPFTSPDTGRRVSIADSVQNVMLFLPFGALGAIACHRRPGSAVGRVVAVTALGGALSVTVETIQLFTLDRVASFADVTTNTFGAALGALLAEQWSGLSLRSLRRLAAAGLIDRRTFYPAIVAAFVVVIAAWEPFDVTLDIGHLGSSLRALWRNPWQFDGFRDEGTALVQYALFAAALSAWLHSLGDRRALLKATALGIVLAVMLEGTQIVIASRMPGVWDALVRVVGVLIGATLWSVGRRRTGSAWWIGLLMIATAGSAVMQMLSPFVVAHARRSFGWLPFMAYYGSNWFPTVSHVIELMLLYFPLGFCLGWMWGRPRTAAVVAIGVTLVVCAPIEYLQGWIVGRYPDISDVAFSLLGAWLGTWTSTRGAHAFEQTLVSLPPDPPLFRPA